MTSRTYKAVFWVVALLACLLVIFLSLLPTLISTEKGKKVTLGLVNTYIPGHLEIDSLHLSWLQGQKIEGFTLYDDQGKTALSFKSFSTEGALLSFLFGRYQLGKTTLVNPSLHYIEKEGGIDNLQSALSRKKKRATTNTDFPSIHGDITLENGEALFEGAKTRPIKISDLHFEMEEKKRVFRLVARTEQGAVIGSILASGNLGKTKQIRASIENFPVALLDELEETTLFTGLLGNQFNLQLEMSNEGSVTTLNSHLDAINLKGELKGRIQQSLFTLDPSSSLTFSLKPPLFTELFNTPDWKLAFPTDIVLTFDELKFPTHLKKLDFKKITLLGHILVGRAELTHENLGNFSLNDFHATLKSKEKLELALKGEIKSATGSTSLVSLIELGADKTLSYSANAEGFPTELLELFLDEASFLPSFLGRNLNFSILGTYRKVKGLDTDFTLASELVDFSGDLGGRLEDLTVNLHGKLLSPFKLTPYLGSAFDTDLEAHLSIVNRRFSLPDLKAHLRNPELDLMLTGHIGQRGESAKYSDMKLTVQGEVHHLPLTKSLDQSGAFEAGRFNLEVDGAKNEILFDLSLANPKSANNYLIAKAKIEHFLTENTIDFQKADIILHANCLRCPLSVFNAVLQSDFPFSALLGDTIDLQFEGIYMPQKEEKKFVMTLDARGDDFSADLALSLNGTLKIDPLKPADIRWVLTPQRYEALMTLFGEISEEQQPPYHLVHSSLIQLNIHELTCPTRGSSTSLSRFFCQSGFVGHFAINEPLIFRNAQGYDIAFEKLNGAINGEDFSQKISVALESDIKARSVPAAEKSGMSFKADLFDFWTLEGKFNRKKLRTAFDLNCKLIPVQETLGILPMQPMIRAKIGAILGELANAHIFGEVSELSGPLTVELKASNLKAVIPMHLSKGGVSLLQNVEAELTLTHAVSDAFLRELHPLLITGAWSQHPIKVQIVPQGFYLPLHPFSLQGVTISRAMIDLGRIHIQNAEIMGLMDFLKSAEISREGVMEAWFTPIYMSLQNGIASYNRFDILLANQAHIALWGATDFVHDRVNMVLGISAATLKQRFDIGGISNSEMFQVKMTGSFSKIDLDWSAASKRISVLVAKSAIGGLGAIVGVLLEQIAGDLGEMPTPPPTTQPFPWE